MNLILINTDPMVSKLVEATARRTGISLIKYAKSSDIDSATIPRNCFFVIDEGAIMDKSQVQKLIKGYTSCLLFSKKPINGFTHTIKKPFLPTQILDLVQEELKRLGFDIANASDITKDQLAPIGSIDDDFDTMLELPKEQDVQDSSTEQLIQDNASISDDTNPTPDINTPNQESLQTESSSPNAAPSEERNFLNEDDIVIVDGSSKALNTESNSKKNLDDTLDLTLIDPIGALGLDSVLEGSDDTGVDDKEIPSFTKEDIKSPDNEDTLEENPSKEAIQDNLGLEEIDFSSEPIKEIGLSPENTKETINSENTADSSEDSGVLSKDDIDEVKQLLEDTQVALESHSTQINEPNDNEVGDETNDLKEDLQINESMLKMIDSSGQSNDVGKPDFDDVPHEDDYTKELQDIMDSSDSTSDGLSLDTIDIDISNIQEKLESKSTQEALETLEYNASQDNHQGDYGDHNVEALQSENVDETTQISEDISTKSQDEDILESNQDMADTEIEQPQDEPQEIQDIPQEEQIEQTDSQAIPQANDTNTDGEAKGSLTPPQNNAESSPTISVQDSAQESDNVQIDDFTTLSEQEICQVLGENLEPPKEPLEDKEELTKLDEDSPAQQGDGLAGIFTNKSIDEIRSLLKGAQITININFADKK